MKNGKSRPPGSNGAEGNQLGTDQLNKNEQYRRFEFFLGENEQAIRGFIRSLLPSGKDLDDLLQEVGLICWKKFETFDSDGDSEDFLRWAFVVARFEVLRHRRNMARDRVVLNEEVINILAVDAEDRIVIAEAERVALKTCIEMLNSTERRLLLSVHTQGDSVARIANELGQRARRLYSKVNALRDILADCVRKKLSAGEVYHEG